MARPVLNEEEGRETGAEKFAKLEPGYQKQILGERAHEAYVRGEVNLDDFVGVRNNERWGQSLYRRGLDDVLKDKSSRQMGARERAPREMLGLRSPASRVVTAEEESFIRQEFVAIGGDSNKLRFNTGAYTGYRDFSDQILVRGNIFPLEGSGHPRSRMSVRAALAHELGHEHYRGTDWEPNGWRDELRASYWAAINVPNLTHAERADLINDAIMQATQVQRRATPNKIMRRILAGEYEHGNR